MTRRVALIAAVFGIASAAMADDAWTVVSADFQSKAAVVKSISADGVSLITDDGKSQSLPLANLVELTHGPAAAVNGLVLCTADGQRLVGKPQRIDGANLVWQADKIGDVSVPLDSVLAVLRDRTTADGLADTRAEDQAKLGTGDTIKGILTEVTADAFVFTPSAGDPVRISPAAVNSILFATPPSGRPTPATPAFLVRIGASTVAAGGVTLAGDAVTLSGVGTGEVKITQADVSAIEHTGGSVAWLSSRVPTEATQTPYFGGSFPARMNTSVLGRPIQFGGRTYAHGIGVHSRSKLVYAVQPGDTTFRTQYAIDGSLPQADVDVRVSLDGKVVHAADGIKAGTLSPVVELNLAGAKTLTLEVDYGKGYDIQDRLNWIEPAIVRGK